MTKRVYLKDKFRCSFELATETDSIHHVAKGVGAQTRQIREKFSRSMESLFLKNILLEEWYSNQISKIVHFQLFPSLPNVIFLA